MDFGHIFMICKSMNFIRRLNRENSYFSSQSFQIWWLIMYGMYGSMNRYKVSAQYL